MPLREPAHWSADQRRGVNKVDAATLGANFGSLAALMRASAAEMAASPGIGPRR